MLNQDLSIREQYLKRLSQTTLRVGRLVAMIGIPIIVFFAIQDRLALGMDNTLAWRAVGLVSWASGDPFEP